jgi:hypothetical protein
MEFLPQLIQQPKKSRVVGFGERRPSSEGLDGWEGFPSAGFVQQELAHRVPLLYAPATQTLLLLSLANIQTSTCHLSSPLTKFHASHSHPCVV